MGKMQGREAIAMGRNWYWFGACGLAIVFLASGSAVAGADAPLADAVERSDRASVRSLLQRRGDGEQAPGGGVTAPPWAGYCDDLETAEGFGKAQAHRKTPDPHHLVPPSMAR